MRAESASSVFIYLFMAVLGPRCRELQRVSLSRRSARALGRSLCSSGARGLGVGLGLQRAGSVVVVQGPRWSPACGIFPDQGYGPCHLRWQAVSLPLSHQGSSGVVLLAFSLLWIVCQTTDLFFNWILICRNSLFTIDLNFCCRQYHFFLLCPLSSNF